MKRPANTKAPASSHKELVAQIAEENRAYMAKLEEEQPLPQPTALRNNPDEITKQKLKDAETTRQILEIYRQPNRPKRQTHAALPTRNNFSDSSWLPKNIVKADVPNNSHKFNKSGFCEICGWEKQFIEKTGRACIGKLSKTQPPKNPSASPFAKLILNGILAVLLWLIISRIFFPNHYHFIVAEVIGIAEGQPYRASIDRYLRNNANDPNSVEIVSLNPATRAADGTLMVDCHFRAKNGLSALVFDSETFVIDEKNNIISAAHY